MRTSVLLFATAALCTGAPQFTLTSSSVEANDFAEVTVRMEKAGGNPFTAVSLTGELTKAGEAPVAVHGFCDSADGSLYRIRFLATSPGDYRYTVRLQTPVGSAESEGKFRATPSRRRGLLRVDPVYPAHFLWGGTGERYFWNGLTAYALMGWQDEDYIRAIIDRAARLKVNRLRVTLVGPRVPDASRWYEPVKPSDKFRFLFGPWIAAHPEEVSDPKWDVKRYDVAFWQKYERLVRHARERDVIISVIFYLDGADAGADPFGKANRFSDDERRYYHYAASRLSAYTNVTWDITNEWHLFRDAWWVEQMGTYLKSVDPYKHLMSCHGRGDFPWMVSQWPDFSMFQMWDEEGGYQAMLKRRRVQAETGRPMPQINEEYGYEDHYPIEWGGNRRPPARSADNRRRLAWQISMAGCYQTTGERANRGDGNPPATPGGWLNGGFDNSMKMLEGYAHMVDFFTSIEYYKLEPPQKAATGGLLVLGEAGRQYVVYYPNGGGGEVGVAPGEYKARWFNPRTGEWRDAQPARVAANQKRWTSPSAPDGQDWALLLLR